MDRSEKIQGIVKVFSEWHAQIVLMGSNNMFSEAIVSETVVAMLLNEIYGWNLENSNLDTSNNEGIDLCDDDARVYVQVTATSLDKKKYTETYKDSVILKHNKGYRIIILSLVPKTPAWVTKKNVPITRNKKTITMPFDPKINYMDLSTLVNYLTKSVNITSEKLDKILDILNLEISNQHSVNDPLILEELIQQLSQANVKLNKSRRGDKASFMIQQKVAYNDLQNLEPYILKYSGKQEVFDNIYREYREQGRDADESVFALLAEKYIFDTSKNSIEKFKNIIDYVKEYLNTNNTGFLERLEEMFPKEHIDRLIPYIIVDAFERCEIFEAPI